MRNRLNRRRVTAGLAALMMAATTWLVAFPAGTASAAPQTDTYYQLISRHSGLALDIAGVSTEPGALLQQWSPSGGQNQQFEFIPTGDGYYRIMARHSGHVIEVFEWNPNNGADIVQWTSLNGTNQQWEAVDQGGGYYSFINRFSGKVLDLFARSTENGARISQWDYHGDANQQWQLVPVDGGGGDPPPAQDSPIGWAAMNGGTTGGAGGTTVTVTSGSQLISEMQAGGPRIIQVQGTIQISGMHRVSSDKTIIGLGSGATIAGGGIDVNAVSNVIIRNINFRDWDDDAINLQEGATNVWVDHNSFTNGHDGAVDIKRESDYVTVSWNHFFNHDKTMLLGHSDNHTADIGHLRVTYHHNWFDGTHTRHPRVRFGNPVHVFNNYFLGNREYGVASTMDAGVLVEGNYFQNVSNPTHVGYAASGPGSLVVSNNIYDNSGAPESTSGGVNPIPYQYQLDNPSSIPSIVPAGAGAGNL